MTADRELPPNRPWTTTDLEYMRKNRRDGAEAIAEHLGRSVTSVRQAAKRHRISLRQPGNRGGLVLGQPRSESWAEAHEKAADLRLQRAIREEALAGTLDLTDLEQQVRRIERGLERPLCPRCTVREVEPKKDVCRVCHLRALAQAHREQKAVADADRELWQARQEKHRRSKRTNEGERA